MFSRYMRFASPTRKIFLILNSIFLFLVALTCVLPLIHILALSLSNKSVAASGIVKFIPIDFTLKAYEYVIKRPAFWRSIEITVMRVITGGLLNLALIVLTAYPLSKERDEFFIRTPLAWFLFFSTLFSGGIIPGYVLIRQLNLLDTLGALILPSAVPVFSVILMLNFFRQLPKELDEAAQIDGAGQFRILFGVYIPCSLPSIATVILFSIVFHWNSYFDGLIFNNFPNNYPLQSYLRTVIVASDLASMGGDEWKMAQEISDRTIKAAQIFIAAIPILCVYPFLQRYFVTGITIGSVKG